jgi:hypothetical protein
MFLLLLLKSLFSLLSLFVILLILMFLIRVAFIVCPFEENKDLKVQPWGPIFTPRDKLMMLKTGIRCSGISTCSTVGSSDCGSSVRDAQFRKEFDGRSICVGLSAWDSGIFLASKVANSCCLVECKCRTSIISGAKGATLDGGPTKAPKNNHFKT